MSHKWDIDNSVDPDQTPQVAASDQGLHYLHLNAGISMKHNNNNTNQTHLLLEKDMYRVMVAESTRLKWVKKTPFQNI